MILREVSLYENGTAKYDFLGYHDMYNADLVIYYMYLCILKYIAVYEIYIKVYILYKCVLCRYHKYASNYSHLSGSQSN